MTRNEAARKVNEAFKAAGVVKKTHDPKCEGFEVEIDGRVATHEFRHGAHAIEQRKDEVARFRLKLVEELCHDTGSAFKPKPEPEAQEPAETPKAQA